jgi:hypothetical protein
MAVIINELEVRLEPEAPPADGPQPERMPAGSGSAQEILLLVEHRRARDERLAAH